MVFTPRETTRFRSRVDRGGGNEEALHPASLARARSARCGNRRGCERCGNASLDASLQASGYDGAPRMWRGARRDVGGYQRHDADEISVSHWR